MSDVNTTYFSECINSASDSEFVGDRLVDELKFVIEPRAIFPEHGWQFYDFVYNWNQLQAIEDIKARSVLVRVINKL